MNLKPPLFLSFGVSLLLIGCVGCASIITSGDKTIPISSNPSDAKVTVFDTKKNVVASGTTPTRIKLKKGAGYFKGADYRLVVEKAGFQPREFEIRHSINGWYFGNFFLGGVLGLVVVDPLTGGVWTLEPEQIDAGLAAGATPSPVTIRDQTLMMLAKDQLTPDQQKHLTPLSNSGGGLER